MLSFYLINKILRKENMTKSLKKRLYRLNVFLGNSVFRIDHNTIKYLLKKGSY